MIVDIYVSKKDKRRIDALVEDGALTRDKRGNVSLLEYLAVPQLETYEVHISGKFLEELAGKGLICFDKKNRVFWMELLLRDLISGKSVEEIALLRDEEMRK